MMECFIGTRDALGRGMTIDFVRRGTLGGDEVAQRPDPGDVFGGAALWVPYDEWRDQPELHAFARFDQHMARAFWSAIDTHRDPPTESKALREALEIERRRVDAFLAGGER